MHVTTIGDCALCARLAYSDSANGGGWASTSSSSSVTGFQGRVFSRDGAVVVAFRGTDSHLDKLVTWPELATRRPPWLQVSPALALARKGLERERRRIAVTGHSLGGALAKVVATFLGIPAVVFDAPDVTVFLGPKRPWIKSIAAVGDPVAGALGAAGTVHVLGLTRQEVKDRVCLPLSALGLTARHEMDRIVNGMQFYSRSLFADPVPLRDP